MPDEQSPRFSWLYRTEWQVARQYGAELAARVLLGEKPAAAMWNVDVMAERRAWTCLRWLRNTGQAVEFTGPMRP